MNSLAQESGEQEPKPEIWSVPYMHYTKEIKEADIVRSSLLVNTRTNEQCLYPSFHIMEDITIRGASAQAIAFRRDQRIRDKL